MSLEELKKELYGDIREFAAELVKCNERKNAFVKETRCDYESFMKRQKKERKRASQKQEQSKVSIKESKSVIQKNFTLPSDCAIHPNSVGMIHFSHIKMLASLIIYLNNEISKISRMVNAIKMWISLKIPRIEDGNNVGVSIQEGVYWYASGYGDICNGSHFLHLHLFHRQRRVTGKGWIEEEALL